MKKLAYGFLHTLPGLTGLHPEYEDLLAYRDGELGGIRGWCVKTHLSRCPMCQRQAELIEEDLRTFKRMDGLFYAADFLNLPVGKENLRRAIEAWEARELDGSGAVNPVRTLSEAALRQLARELDHYLGNHATATLLRQMRNGERPRRDPLAESESVLREFLGPRAASAVTQRILYAQMSKDRSPQRAPVS